MSAPPPADRYIVNVEGIVVRDGRFLLGVRSEAEEHAPGTLAPPGGKVEGGAAAHILEETARREVREEVGVEVADEITYLGSSLFVTAAGVPVVNVVMLCRYRAGTAAPVAADEFSSVAWLTAAEVAAHPLAPPWTRSSIALAAAFLARGARP